MAEHRIICTNVHPHITSVGTGSKTAGYEKKWSVNEVVAAIKRGDRFYTKDDKTGKVAPVEAFVCDSCNGYVLRTKGDNTKANNLESMPDCKLR